MGRDLHEIIADLKEAAMYIAEAFQSGMDYALENMIYLMELVQLY